MNKRFTDEVQMTNKHKKKRLRLTSIKEYAIKFIRCNFTSIKLEKIKASEQIRHGAVVANYRNQPQFKQKKNVLNHNS